MIHLCVGRRELGKTTLALYLTRNVRPRITFDPRGLVPAPQGRLQTIEDVQLAFTQLHDAIESGGHNRADLVVTPDRDTQGVFDFTCGEIKGWLQRDQPVGFIVDESTFVDLNIESFEWIIRCAPRRAAQVVLTQHRPYDVPVRIRSIVDVWCVFRQVEPRDLDVIAERCTKAFADQVSKLRPREFMSWDDTKVDNNAKIHLDASVWFVPLATSVESSGVAGRVDLPPTQLSPHKKIGLFNSDE